MHVDVLKSWSARVPSAISTAKILTVVLCAAAALPSLAHAQAGAPANITAKVSVPDASADIGKNADSVFGRLPCSAPKSLARMNGVLARTAKKLSLNEPLTIVALGSSSTAGAGASSPEFSYPNRLSLELKRRFPKANISVINRGANGEETVDMIARMDAVLGDKPDLVIWQFGTNAVLRDTDATTTAGMVEQGLVKLKAARVDVLFVDPQFAPKVIAKSTAKEMVTMIGGLARKSHIPVFQRYAVMEHWHKEQSIDFDKFVVADGLHMNDWGYACFARVLGDSLADAVASSNVVANAAGSDRR